MTAKESESPAVVPVPPCVTVACGHGGPVRTQTLREGPPRLRKAPQKPATAEKGTVNMSDMAFLLAMITVSGGQNMVWKNSSQVIHSVEDDASKALDMADVILPSSLKLFDSNYCNPVTRLPAFSQGQESTFISALCMKPAA